MNAKACIPAAPAERKHRRSYGVRHHRLSVCEATGLVRYRDRHQARDGAKATAAGSHNYRVSTFSCPDCRGHHVEKTHTKESITISGATQPSQAFAASLVSRKRRYFLVDIENPTRGAKATCDEVALLWNILKTQSPGVAPHDHVVVGASRSVARKYRSSIHGANVKWIIGADAPNGADRALLAAIDLRRVARDYDELVIVSGDWVFTDLTRQAKQAGLSVQVVTAEHPEQRSMLSRQLADAADTRTRIRLEARTARSGPAPMTNATCGTHPDRPSFSHAAA